MLTFFVCYNINSKGGTIMIDKLFGVDIVNLYNYDLDESYNFVKDNTDYLKYISIEEVKDINFSFYKDIIILMCDGTVTLNGKKTLNNIKTLAFMSGLSIFAISNDRVITCLTGNDELYSYINNDNYKYKKILVTPLVILGLTYDKDVRLYGTLCDKVVDYKLYFNVDDIGYVEENDDIVIIKECKVFSLFHEHDYSNEKPDVLVEGTYNDLEII